MKRYSIVAIAAAVGLVGAGLASAGLGAAHAADKLKIGFIYLGPIGDLGWTYQHDLGRKMIEKEFGVQKRPLQIYDDELDTIFGDLK